MKMATDETSKLPWRPVTDRQPATPHGSTSEVDVEYAAGLKGLRSFVASGTPGVMPVGTGERRDPQSFFLSPSHTLAEWEATAEADRWLLRVDIFEDAVLGWQLDVAQALAASPGGPNRHTGFAILSIVASYFEMIAKHRAGFPRDKEGASAQYFCKGVQSVFDAFAGQTDVHLKPLYEHMRCGLYL
jgi:hypothetical protein